MKLWACEFRSRPKGTERSGEHVGLSSGHAIYEAIVKGDTSMRAIQLPVTLSDSGDSSDSAGVRAHQNVIKQVDELVANAIAGEIFTADHFDSIKVSEAFVAH